MEVFCVSCGELVATPIFIPACFVLREDVRCSECESVLEYSNELLFELGRC